MVKIASRYARSLGIWRESAMRPVRGVDFLRMGVSGVMSYYYEYAKKGEMMTKGEEE